jgi:hypothetical protein
VDHRESGMIRVAMTYRLCSPSRFETVPCYEKQRSSGPSRTKRTVKLHKEGLHGAVEHVTMIELAARRLSRLR